MKQKYAQQTVNVLSFSGILNSSIKTIVFQFAKIVSFCEQKFFLFQNCLIKEFLIKELIKQYLYCCSKSAKLTNFAPVNFKCEKVCLRSSS